MRADQDAVNVWRLEQLVCLGFPADEAERLAASGADIREIEGLLAAGCRHDLAARICAPLIGREFSSSPT